MNAGRSAGCVIRSTDIKQVSVAVAALLLATAAAGESGDNSAPAATARLVPAGARVDLYSTNIASGDANLTLERRLLLGGTTTESAEFRIQASPEFGARMLGWYGPLAFAFDISHFKTENTSLSVGVTPVTAAVGLRAPRALLPRLGGVHPYALLGISQLTIKGRAQLATISTSIHMGSTFLSTGEPETAPFLAAGLEWHLGDRLALVAEYRRRRYDIDDLSTNSWIFPTENIIASGRFAADGTSLGISWLFDAPSINARIARPPAEPPLP